MYRWLFAVMLAVATAGLSAPLEKPAKVVPVVNDPPPWQQVGQQPYEMTWVQRQQDPRTLVDFEDLKGWTLELYDGAEGELRRTREQQMWGQYVAGIFHSGIGEKSRVVARPPEPIAIPGRFDSIDLWGYADRLRAVGTPVYISILVRDARGKEFKFQLNEVHWVHWWLIHHHVSSDTLKQVAWPASFSGIEISMVGKHTARYFYCDSLAFYIEEHNPLKFPPQPRRNLKPFRGQIVGTNTGTGTLPFPTREETILPTNLVKDFQVSARQTGRNRFELRYTGRDATINYEYKPRTGNLSELSVSVGDAPSFRPLDGGGIRFADTPEDRVAEGELVSASLTDATVRAKFRYGSRLVDYELRLWQKSLVLDVWCNGGQATELRFGRVSGVTRSNALIVPYITYESSSRHESSHPRVLMSGSESKPVFTSIWFDWYRSNASEPYFKKEPKVTADSAEINGGMRYIAKTDGQRNNLYDRIFVTVSPTYEETLPTIANPPSLRQLEGKQVVWTATGPESFEKDHQRCRKIRSYGLNKIMQHSHETAWRDHYDSFTLRLRAAPQKGGDAALRWYNKAQNDLGWLQGVYTNYCDLAPVNTNWSPDHVQRMPDGEWRRAWRRTYALKPAKAVEFNEYYAQRIKEKFGAKMSYTDVHTAVPPWRYCDFDARVPGAGTFAATFYAYGQLLLNDQRVYGPTQSEATFQWLYAGLQSGGYGWVYIDVNLLTHPLDVAFQLNKIHPLEADYGMGDPSLYLGKLDPRWKESPKRRDYVDLFLATSIGYGNMGMLITDGGLDDPFSIEVMARSYYMMQQLQQQYAFVRPKRIKYADASGRFLTPSEAHATGVIADSRLHVVYENGTEVHVNRSTSSAWTVKDRRGESVELPPSGWLAFNPANGFYELSASVGGRRIDHVQAPDFEFLDGRGQWTMRGNLGAAGSVALRAKGAGVLELIDIYGNDRIGFQSKSAGVLHAYDPEGKSLGAVSLKCPRPGWYEFKPVPSGRAYVFAPPR